MLTNWQASGRRSGTGAARTNREEWDTRYIKSAVAVFLNGAAIGEPDDRGEHVVDDSFLILFNAYHEPIDFIPDLGVGDNWRIELDTAAPRDPTDHVVTVRTKEWLTVAGRSITAISMTAAG